MRNTIDEKNRIRIERICEENPDKVYLKDFADYINSASSTKYNYISVVVAFLNYINKSVENLEEQDYHLYLSTIIDKTSSYRIMIYSALKKFSEFLIYMNIADEDNMKNITRPTFIESSKTETRRQRGFVTKEDIDRCINAIDSGIGNHNARIRQQKWKNRDKAILLLFISSGIRVSDMFELNVDDIDIHNGRLIVNPDKNGQILIALSNQTLDVMADWLVDRERLLEGIEENALFISNQRTRMTPYAISDIVKKFTSTLENGAITPSDLRKSYAAYLYEETGNFFLVKEKMGHASALATEKSISAYIDSKKCIEKEESNDDIEYESQDQENLIREILLEFSKKYSFFISKEITTRFSLTLREKIKDENDIKIILNSYSDDILSKTEQLVLSVTDMILSQIENDDNFKLEDEKKLRKKALNKAMVIKTIASKRIGNIILRSELEEWCIGLTDSNKELVENYLYSRKCKILDFNGISWFQFNYLIHSLEVEATDRVKDAINVLTENENQEYYVHLEDLQEWAANSLNPKLIKFINELNEEELNYLEEYIEEFFYSEWIKRIEHNFPCFRANFKINNKNGYDFGDEDIEFLELSIKSYNCLKRDGINTISELLEAMKQGPERMLHLRNLGRKGAEEILYKVKEISPLIWEEYEKACNGYRQILYFVDTIDNDNKGDRYYIYIAEDKTDSEIRDILNNNSIIIEKNLHIVFFDSYSEEMTQRVESLPNFKEKLLFVNNSCSKGNHLLNDNFSLNSSWKSCCIALVCVNVHQSALSSSSQNYIIKDE